MSTKNRLIKHWGWGLIIGSLMVIALGLIVFTSGLTEAAAKDPNKERVSDVDVNSKGANKTLKIVEVSSPPTFKGSNPYPTRPLNGQKLLTVTIDLDRDFKSHLQSSETGEVFLSEKSGQVNYYTVDTAIPQAEGPGKKPSRQATFVFAVPQNASGLTFNYGTRYSLPLPKK